MNKGPVYIQDTNLSCAWTKAFLEIMEPGVGEILPLVVTVTELINGEPTETKAIRQVLDDALIKNSKFPCDSVANTIFPSLFGILRKGTHNCLSDIKRCFLDSRRQSLTINMGYTLRDLLILALKERKLINSNISFVPTKAAIIDVAHCRLRSSIRLLITRINGVEDFHACNKLPLLLMETMGLLLQVFMLLNTSSSVPMATISDCAILGASLLTS